MVTCENIAIAKEISIRCGILVNEEQTVEHADCDGKGFRGLAVEIILDASENLLVQL